jgi:hypothetical protein
MQPPHVVTQQCQLIIVLMIFEMQMKTFLGDASQQRNDVND